VDPAMYRCPGGTCESESFPPVGVDRVRVNFKLIGAALMRLIQARGEVPAALQLNGAARGREYASRRR
jgi:hypothetical protein